MWHRIKSELDRPWKCIPFHFTAEQAVGMGMMLRYMYKHSTYNNNHIAMFIYVVFEFFFNELGTTCVSSP